MNVQKFVWIPVVLSLLVFELACARNRAKTAHDHDTLVPERTQRESERLMTEQQMMMQDLNSTPSERAGAAHELERDRRHDRQNDAADE